MALRNSQPPGESAEFRQSFGEIVLDIDPTYTRNRSARGTRVEFLREIAPGVFASHNVNCFKGVYHHGFCLTFHQEIPGPYLLSPFIMGGRFDHNNSAKKAYFRDIKPDRKWPFGELNFSDSHSFRKGWRQIVEKCTRIAEEEMLPNYFSKLAKYKTPLLALLQKAISIGQVSIIIDRGRGYTPCHIEEFDFDMLRFVESFNANRLNSEEFLDEVVRAKPELFNRVLKMKSLNRLLEFLST